VDNEQVIVQLTNNTLDGVADTVVVSDSVASSTPGAFSLNDKGATKVDTLMLRWTKVVSVGDHLLPLTIGRIPVAKFAARKFDTNVDRARRVACITGLKHCSLIDALRRIGINAGVIDSVPSPLAFNALDVVIIDRRTFSLRNDLRRFAPLLDHFVEGGGHLIIMAQDEAAWNDTLFFPGLRLKKTSMFDENSPLWIDSTRRLLSYPNKLVEDDFNGWIFQRAYNSVVIKSGDHVVIPLKEMKSGSPLVLTKQRGRGNITYIDLALQPQLMNINPGAFRLLANLISY
jgi:hypothetical protein